MKVEVSDGELYDKVTILQIKNDKGLPVEKELSLLEKTMEPLLSEYPATQHLFGVLKQINNELWIIEDTKREYEKQGVFDHTFIQYSRLVYLLNDQRATVKKSIDKLTLSNITEYKQHSGENK